MVLAHPAVAFWHHFHPWITQKINLETVSHFDIQNHRKSSYCTQSGSQEAPKMDPKINKNRHLALSVSIGCPPGPHDYQNGAPGTQKTT